MTGKQKKDVPGYRPGCPLFMFRAVEFHTAELRRVVEQINREEVEDMEVLSDSVYCYYADRDCMEIVE